MARDLRDVGGTRGGIGMFLFGLALAVTGGYLLLTQVDVNGGYWQFGSMGFGTSFGITIIPLILGVGLLFYDSRSIPGWALTGLGGVTLLIGIIANMQIHFRTTNLYNTLVMLVLIVAGLGLVFRSMRPVGRAPEAGDAPAPAQDRKS